MQVPQLSLEQQFELQRMKDSTPQMSRDQLITLLTDAKRLLAIKNKVLQELTP